MFLYGFIYRQRMEQFYVCKTFDQFREQCPSKSRPDVVHMVTFDRATRRLVCSCEGFHNWGKCSHVSEIISENSPKCTWAGSRPIMKGTEGTCPSCGEKVYEITDAGSVKGATVHYPNQPRTMITQEEEETHLHLDKTVLVSGDVTIVDNGSDIYVIDSDRKDDIVGALYGDTSSFPNVPKMSRDRAERVVTLLSEVI